MDSLITLSTIYSTVSGTFTHVATDAPVNFMTGVNLGVTEPGHSPGEVILDYDDYMLRFRHLEATGANVIRVYALLRPGFYQALRDWNTKESWTIYVFHGTAFPELPMEHDSAFNHTDTMLADVDAAVTGAYGLGDAIVRPYTQEVETYDVSIAPWLLGWTVSGEISPDTVYKTSLDPRGQECMANTFTWVHPRANASYFECWATMVMDHLCIKMAAHGHAAPVTHTNWVTTDGLSHPLEPRITDGEYQSTEDWQEFDLRNIDFTQWPAGSWYSNHAYPYYPELVKVGPGADVYRDYMRRLVEEYTEWPMVITETGLPTSLGMSSFDEIHGRHYGGISEDAQGLLLAEIITMIKDLGASGVILFQLYDEWFKRSWNTRDYDQNRAMWHNSLTSEQYFGLYATESMGYVQKKGSTKMTYEGIQVDVSKCPCIFEVDAVPGGDLMNPIDLRVSVDATGKVLAEVDKDHDVYRSAFQEWLEPNSLSALGRFQEYRMLVKTPTMAQWVDPGCTNYDPEAPWDMMVPCTVSGNKTYYGAIVYAPTLEVTDGTLVIPYAMMGISDPSKGMSYQFTDGGRDHGVNFVKTSGVTIHEAISDKTITMDWPEWVRVDWYRIRPKAGLNHIRQALGLPPIDLSTLVWVKRPLGTSIHYWVVKISLWILLVANLLASVGQFILRRGCFLAKDAQSAVPRLQFMCLGVAAGLYYLDGILVPEDIRVEWTYVALLVTLSWDSLILLLTTGAITWKLSPGQWSKDVRHAFIVTCHNSGEVIGGTLDSLLTRVPGSTVYVIDNGSTPGDQDVTHDECANPGRQLWIPGER